jgi:ubiquinone/menaquinone biosynthesis C-methylase UbiE
MITLIRAGITPGGRWADLGAGTGNFTRALAALIGADASITALDRDRGALEGLARTWPPDGPALRTLSADLARPLPDDPALRDLDGVLMANVLHWLRDQRGALARVCGCLRPGGRLIVVEYDVTTPRGYIPYPVSFTQFERLAREAGFTSPRRVGERRSPSTGIMMYAGGATR